VPAIILNGATLQLSETPCGMTNNATAIYKQLLHRKIKLISL
jgi:hypothetical protein